MRNNIAQKAEMKRLFLTEQLAAALAAASGSETASLHDVRGVINTNIAGYTNVGGVETIPSFTVAASTTNDGVAYTQGQRLLLVGQTLPAQNGIWVVGVVGGGTAPLTRPADWQTGTALLPGTLVAVADGNVGSSTYWFVQTQSTVNAGGVWTPVAMTIGTTPVVFQPVAGLAAALAGSMQPSAHSVRMLAQGSGTTFPGGGTYVPAAGGAPESVTGFTAVTGGTLLDGILLTVGQRVLVVGLTNAANGIWEVQSITGTTGVLTRPADWLTGALIPAGSTVTVAEGNTGVETVFSVGTASALAVGAGGGTWTFAAITVGTTAGVVFQPVAAPSRYGVRAVITALPGAYTGTGTGILTASGNGAIVGADGVTLVTGDYALLAEGATNITAALDAGPYCVVDPGAAGRPYILARPTWWAHNAVYGGVPGSAALPAGVPVIPEGVEITVGGAGTLFGGTTWKAFMIKGSQVDGAAPLLFPRSVTQQITLVAGTTAALQTVPIRSATKSNVYFARTTANTTAATITYQPLAAITPGAIGTASLTYGATVAAGTINAADISTGNLTIQNW